MTNDIDVRELRAEKLESVLRHIAAICGNPDAQLACRLILLEVKEALK